jgi:hypothetical protein
MRMEGEDAALGQAVKGLPLRFDEKRERTVGLPGTGKGTIGGLADSCAAY